MKKDIKKISVFILMLIILGISSLVIIPGVMKYNEIKRENLDIEKLATIKEVIQSALQDDSVQEEIAAWIVDNDFTDIYLGENSEFAYGYVRDVYPNLYKEIQVQLEQMNRMLSASTFGGKIYVRISKENDVQIMVENGTDIIKTKYSKIEMIK